MNEKLLMSRVITPTFGVWTPIDVCLPQKYCEDGVLYQSIKVLCTLKNGHVCETWWSGSHENFSVLQNAHHTNLDDNPVIAWMPMPSPYMHVAKEG